MNQKPEVVSSERLFQGRVVGLRVDKLRLQEGRIFAGSDDGDDAVRRQSLRPQIIPSRVH
jgi:hypothetical protein